MGPICCSRMSENVGVGAKAPTPTFMRSCSYTCPCTLHTPYRCMCNWLISFLCTTWRGPTFVAKTCSCALHTANSIPPNLRVCLTIYTYTLKFDLFDTQQGWRTSKLIDWLRLDLRPHGPDAPWPSLTGPLCSISIYGSPIPLLKFQVAPPPESVQ